jgi:glycosyltransferase involved in cell wall biosynthesis
MYEVKPVLLKPVTVERSFLPLVNAAAKIITQKIDLSEFQALVVCSADFGDLITFRNHNKPLICLCLTPLKIIHDPYTRQKLLDDKKANPLLFKLLEMSFKVVERQAWKRYRCIISISKEVKNRIVCSRLAPKERIFVSYPGIDPQLYTPIWNYEPFFLLPGRIMWEKNIELAISAFTVFKQQFREASQYKLVIAGTVDQKSQSYYEELLKMTKDNPYIKIINSPSDEELKALYQNCYASIFTALNEDWGLVVLEAMACGKPVISVNRGGPTEALEPGITGILVDPIPERFAKAMEKLASDLELVRAMGKKAQERSLDFTWDKFVSQIDDCVDSTIKGNN